MLKIILPAGFTKAEQAEVLRWLDDVTGARLDWPTLVKAFNRLRQAILIIPNRGRRTFASLYANLIDRHLTDPFINALYGLTNVQQESIPLWAEGARQVQPFLEAAGLYVANSLPSRLLLAYCLYWWKATTKGYAFEVEILRDILQSHLTFTAHDPRLRSERFTPYDLMISGFKGDIKTSTYFLRLSTQRLKSQFYITRLWLSRTRSRTLVVFQKTLMWDKINGDTLLVYWHQLQFNFPQPMRIILQRGEFVVTDYEIWKQKMQAYQTQEETKDAPPKNA
jgi:hypothetical protein